MADAKPTARIRSGDLLSTHHRPEVPVVLLTSYPSAEVIGSHSRCSRSRLYLSRERTNLGCMVDKPSAHRAARLLRRMAGDECSSSLALPNGLRCRIKAEHMWQPKADDPLPIPYYRPQHARQKSNPRNTYTALAQVEVTMGSCRRDTSFSLGQWT